MPVWTHKRAAGYYLDARSMARLTIGASGFIQCSRARGPLCPTVRPSGRPIDCPTVRCPSVGGVDLTQQNARAGARGPRDTMTSSRAHEFRLTNGRRRLRAPFKLNYLPRMAPAISRRCMHLCDECCVGLLCACRRGCCPGEQPSGGERVERRRMSRRRRRRLEGSQLDTN